MVLTTAQQHTLAQSSSHAIEASFSKVKKYFHRNRWFSTRNRYQRTPAKILAQDSHTGTAIVHRDLSDYIAASTSLHCTDGWSYLSCAIEAQMRGNAGACTHFGYYAELRAAMAILAAQGVGIFDDRHFVVNPSRNCLEIPSASNGRKVGTHQIAWLALKHWATLPAAGDLIFEAIRPAGIRLGDWVGTFNPGATPAIIASEWLKKWGLDLERLADDRTARNEASYGPTCVYPNKSLAVSLSCGFVKELWHLCQPALSCFENLDRYLLRRTLQATFHAITGTTHMKDRAGYKHKVVSMLSLLDPPGLAHDRWYTFLARSKPPKILSEAEGELPHRHVGHHVQVLARAALLLRVASGACAALCQDASVKQDDLRFWWRPFGEQRGLWNPHGEPLLLKDLWDDVNTALEDLSDWQAGAGPNPDLARLRRERSQALSVLSGCERIGLWGLGL